MERGQVVDVHLFRTSVMLVLAGCGLPEAPAPGHLRQALPSTSLLISQVFGGGDATTPQPPFRTDFVELHNASGQAVALSAYTLQYAAAQGNNWLVVDFDPAATLAAGGYHLVAFSASTGTRGAQLPTPDSTNTLINVGRVDFKLALVSGAGALSATCPLSTGEASRVVDFLGAGSANCSEGPQAPPASITTALVRKGEGCVDTDRNADDFEALAPAPRNGQTPPILCLADAGAPGRPDSGLTPPMDGGVDAGTAEPDAGAAHLDAGRPEADAGAESDGGRPLTADGGPSDAGRPVDAGATDAGGGAPSLSGRSSCRCASADLLLLWPLLGLGLRRRRPSRRANPAPLSP